MMRKNQYFRYVLTGIVYTIGFCMAMTGCGVRDSALVIPIAEDEVEETGLPKERGVMQNPAEGEALPLIYVYVCGAVVMPGVYAIPETSRVNDALQAAGGFTEDAGKEYMNLAAKVTDGEKLYFPTIAEAEELMYAKEAQLEGLVNINTANVSLLMTLPGIGEARAQEIITYREEHGDFQNKEDLQKVPGIKENMYAKLCDKIIVQ